MIIFYDKLKKYSYITPYRNGSQFLKKKSSELNLIFFELHEIESDDTIKSFAQTLVENSEKRLFIYRDPIERFYSFFYNFLYAPEKNKEKETETKNSLKNLCINKNDLKSHDILSCILQTLPNIKQFSYNDYHTRNQYSLLTFLGIEIEKFEIIDFSSYEKFLKLHFTDTKIIGEWDRKKSLADFSLSLFDIEKIIEIRKDLLTIYKDDIANIKPRVIKL